jgi:maleylpyruvate isomerase
MSRPNLELNWMAEGFQYVVAELSRLDDDAVDEPSALPGWSRKHVVSHLGFNARAVRRLVDWAHTGEVTPMYPSPMAREQEIDEGAQWTAARLREFIHTEQESLSRAMNALDDTEWSSDVITGQGRTVAASELPWMRTRELWIHAADLNAGGDVVDFPAGIIDRLVVEVVNKRRAGDAPGLDVHPTDRALSGLTPIPGAPCLVEGSAADLARWLTRRETRGLSTSDRTPLPELGPCL